MRLPASVLLLLSLGLAGCGALGGVRELFAGSDPIRHAGLLAGLHDGRTWRHEPDVPPTWDACLREILALRDGRYASPREAGAAVHVLARCAADDPSALHRAEAVAALARAEGAARQAADPPAVPADEEEVGRAIRRLQGLHDPRDGLHVTAEAGADCADALRTIGDLRPPAPASPTEDESRRALRLLRGALLAVLAETASADAHGGGGLRAAADRALANLSSEVAGLALASAALFDPDERVRGEAIEAIPAVRTAGAVAALRAAYPRERSEAVRRRLVRALGRAAAPGSGPGSADAFAVLVVALDDDSSAVRWSAREALCGATGQDLGDRPEPWKRWWIDREKRDP